MPGDLGRRRLLATLAGSAAFAGCSSLTGDAGTGDDDGEETLTPAPVPSPSPTGTPRPETVETSGEWADRVDVAALRGAGRTVALHPRPADDVRLAVGVGFVRGADDDGPPVLRVVVRNRTDAPVGLPVAAPLGSGDTLARRVAGGGGAVLRSTSGRRGARRASSGCWRSNGAATTGPGPRSPEGAGDVTATGTSDPVDATTRLEPGGTLAGDYWLLAPPEGACLPTGLYRVPTGVDWRFTFGVWRTDAPGPSERSRHAGRSPPPLPVRGTPAWYHEATAGTRVYLDPGAERLSAPATARFVLRNHAREPLVGNPAAYEFLKLVDGRWFSIVPDAVPTPPGRLPPGDRQPWRLALSHGPSRVDSDGIPVGFLGGGTYGFRVGMARRGSPRVHAAVLDLDAPRAPLLPTGDLEVTRSGGDTVFARDARATADGGATLVGRRVPAPDAEVFVREQVMQSRGLRNTVGVLETRAATQVRLRTGAAVANRLVPADRWRLRLRTADGRVGYELRQDTD